MEKLNLCEGWSCREFYKEKEDVEVINSNSLPFGVLDRVDIDIVEKNVKNGDLIISISDGILDNKENSSFNVEWLVNFLENTNIKQPKDLAISILKKLRNLMKEKLRNDMTVIVYKNFYRRLK